MRSFRKEAKVILIFFVFLTIFTIFSNFNFDSEQSSAKSLQNISGEIIGVEPGSARAPASIDENALLILNKEFLCNPSAKPTQDKVAKHMVMISFRMCQELKSVLNVALENQSNGFKAQIFKVEKNNFKTDYIQLDEGLNRLKLNVVLKDGQKLEESLEILSGS